jgi:microfibrillar-associated protein 1
MGTRKPAPRLAVPAQRYFKGKAPVKGADPLEFDSDVDEAVEPQDDQDEVIAAYGQQDEVASKPSNVSHQLAKAERSVKVELRDVKVSAEGKIIGAAPEVSAESLSVQSWFWSFSYVLDMLTLKEK